TTPFVSSELNSGVAPGLFASSFVAIRIAATFLGSSNAEPSTSELITLGLTFADDCAGYSRRDSEPTRAQRCLDHSIRKHCIEHGRCAQRFRECFDDVLVVGARTPVRQRGSTGRSFENARNSWRGAFRFNHRTGIERALVAQQHLRQLV